MNRTLIIGTVTLILIILGSLTIYYYYQQRQLNDLDLSSNLPNPTSTFKIPSPTPSPSSITKTTSQVTRQPDSGASNTLIKKVGITIIEPQEYSFASSPIVVRGYANVFEGQVTIKLVDAQGDVLATTQAKGCMGEEACLFEALLMFTKPQSNAGTLQTFSTSAKDGSVENLQEVAITFN